MRQFRVNAVLLAFAVSPLVFAVCANLATGGSLAKALEGSNLIAFPFLLLSGAAMLIYNFTEASKRRDQQLPNKPIQAIKAVRPTVRKIRNQLALTGGAVSGPGQSQAEEPDGEAYPDTPSATVEDLVADLWAKPGGDIEPKAYRAAWSLSALMASSNARAAIGRLTLTSDQLSQGRLRWLTRPREAAADSQPATAGSQATVDVVQGRIGYLLRKGGAAYAHPPLAVDPYLAIALITVRENDAVYHSLCPARPHEQDGEKVRLLESYREGDELDAPQDTLNPRYLRYLDIGKLIRPELSHTRPALGAKQADLVRHVMRHFLTDELSAVLFDALPNDVQARLAGAMMKASRWVSPAAWQDWVRTGHSQPHAQKTEVMSNSSFVAACLLAASVVTLAGWQLVIWISNGWSWYFGPSHLLATWPGWLKAFLAIGVAVAFTMWLFNAYPFGVYVGVIGGIFLGASVLASPVVRIHAWISSWGTASTIVVGAIILAAVAGWLGYSYDDRSHVDEAVRLNGIDRFTTARLALRSRYRPDHAAGHADWCTARVASG